VEDGARELAHMAAAVAQTLDVGRSGVPVALSGGVLLASTTYRQSVLIALESLGVRAEPVAIVREPAQGALRLALAPHGEPGA
jgi:N-acetylmuramic acid 6-phosphate etherase